MIEIFQGLAACIIGSFFFACIMAPFVNSGRHAAEERIEEDRRQYFPEDELSRRQQTRRARV